MSAPLGRRAMLLGGAAAVAGAGATALARPSSAFGATAPMVLESDSPSSVPLTIKGASGQTANITEWRDSGNALMARVTHSGFLHARQLFINTADQGQGQSPEVHYKAANGEWLSGIDWAAAIPARDYVVAAKVDHPTAGSVFDLIYCSHNGSNAPTVGVGIAQPDRSYRLQVFSDSDEPDQGGLMVRSPVNQTARPFAVRWAFSSPAVDLFAVNADGSFEATNKNRQKTFGVTADGWLTPLKVRSDGTRRPLRMVDSDGTRWFDFQYSDGGYLSFVNTWTGRSSWRVGSDGRLEALQTINARTHGIQVPHVSGGTPSGGSSGEIRVGNNRLWVNDRGTWKSISL
ncbi:MAG: hypothetical protein M3340_02240 [Actinomycetota bacterium]|nr:hypothetical protein [Actinomycetota bacterium]